MLNLRDQTVLILGLGDSGLAMARWCSWCGATVHVADTREAPPQAQALARDVPSATLHMGFDVALLQGKQRLLRSPGLSPLAADVAAMVSRAQADGIAVQGELDLFAQALADLKTTRDYAPKVLAITGTNGKTTTTSLTAKLVERAGLRVGLAGNIGPTMLDTLREALMQEPEPEPEQAQVQADVAPIHAARIEDEAAKDDAAKDDAEAIDDADASAETQASDAATDAGHEPAQEPADEPALALVDDPTDLSPLTLLVPPPVAPVFQVLPEVWVLELSSFQLEGVQGFEPSAAVVLNVSQDHLDWHGDMQAYGQAKARIYGKQTTWVVNRDDDVVMAMVPAPVAVKAAGRGRKSDMVGPTVVRFGLDAPRAPGDFGLMHESGMSWLVRASEPDPTVKLKAGEAHDIIIQRLMPADALKIRGRHNAANALAALALATSAGIALGPMLHALRDYRGEPHRVETVMTVGGIDAIDDSKGTNVGATVAALLGLGPDVAPGKLLIILGGDGKGQDFAPLREPVSRYARAVACIGRDAAAIAQALRGEHGLQNGHGEAIALQHHDSLPAATRWAFAQAQAGDAVLLSPACASLDMFRNYAHRAEVFVAAVRELALERGEVQA
jgi:UDP-N-acetylmuramoylalanine--D-glutamate ligase